MNISKLSYVSLAVITALGLTGCGGGGTDSGAGSTDTRTVGVVSGFGSIYVNGCEYETGSSSISVEGQSATEDDLSVGDVVEVTGPANCTSGTATQIKSADELEGWVDSVSVANGVGTMVVMGQTITVNDMTVFEDYTGSVATINDIAANHVVEINGFSSDQGTIYATRIEVKATSLASYIGELELKGVVKNYDDNASTFDIGTLTINYSAITPGFTISNGLLVEVKFNDSKTPISIEIEDDGKLGYHGDEDEEVEVYGVLTSAQSNNEFMLGEQKVQVTDSTEYEEMDGADTLQTKLADTNMLGKLYLEVEGKFVGGVLVAKKVEFEDDIADNNECKGTVSNLAATAGEMNAGTLTVNAATTAECEGQTSMDVTVNNSTMMEDDSTANVSKFNLTYLRDGDVVEVYVDPASGAAIKLERK